MPGKSLSLSFVAPVQFPFSPALATSSISGVLYEGVRGDRFFFFFLQMPNALNITY